jgi:hypothetical protein
LGVLLNALGNSQESIDIVSGAWAVAMPLYVAHQSTVNPDYDGTMGGTATNTSAGVLKLEWMLNMMYADDPAAAGSADVYNALAKTAIELVAASAPPPISWIEALTGLGDRLDGSGSKPSGNSLGAFEQKYTFAAFAVEVAVNEMIANGSIQADSDWPPTGEHADILVKDKHGKIVGIDWKNKGVEAHGWLRDNITGYKEIARQMGYPL